MSTTVFSLSSAGESYLVTSISPGFPFTLSKSSGDTIPVGAIIDSAGLNFSATYQYSALRLFVAALGASNLHDPRSTSGNSASANILEALNVALYETNFYAGLEELGITVKGAGKGGASTDGNVFSIRSNSSITLTVNWHTQTATGAPTTVVMSGVVAETDTTMTFSGATPGESNAISGYEIQYAESADGSTWSSWTALKTITSAATYGSTTVALSSTRGNYRKYRIRTLGAEGIHSDWVETAAVRKNSAPISPTMLIVSPKTYLSGGVFIGWSGQSDADNNINHYVILRAISTDGGATFPTIDEIATVYASPYIDYPSASSGNVISYSVKAVDAFDVGGSYDVYDFTVINTPPSAPTINAPGAGKTIYNSRPRFLVTLGADVNGQNQTISASGYAPSTLGAQSPGKKLILQSSNAASIGTVSISATQADSLGAASSAATRSTTYAEPVFTDAALNAGGTPTKAVHMTEIREMVNTVRAYYGLSAYAWAETITAGTTPLANWSAHVTELRTAIDEVIAYVNAWDTTATANKIPVPSWIVVTSGQKPSAAAIEQIRAVLVTL